MLTAQRIYDMMMLSVDNKHTTRERDKKMNQEQTIAKLQEAANNPLAGLLQKSILETVAYMVEVKGIEYALAYVSEQLPQQIGMNSMLGYGKAKTILESN